MADKLKMDELIESFLTKRVLDGSRKGVTFRETFSASALKSVDKQEDDEYNFFLIFENGEKILVDIDAIISLETTYIGKKLL